MIYYYKVRVEFLKGSQIIIKDYRVDFLTIGKLFLYLETKHKNNYKLVWVKERRSYDFYFDNIKCDFDFN